MNASQDGSMNINNSISSSLLGQLSSWRFALSSRNEERLKIASTTLAAPMIALVAAIETIVYSVLIPPSYLISRITHKPLSHLTGLWNKSTGAFMQSFTLLSNNFVPPIIETPIIPTHGTPLESGIRFLHAILQNELANDIMFIKHFELQGLEGKPFEYVMLKTIVYYVLKHPCIPLPSFLHAGTIKAIKALREDSAFIKALKTVYKSPKLMTSLEYSVFNNANLEKLENTSLKKMFRTAISLKGIEEPGSLLFCQCWTLPTPAS